MYFRLTSVIDVPTNIYVVHKVAKPDGFYKKGEQMRLEPGVIYDTDGDEVFEKSVRALGMREVRYTKAMESRLKEAGVYYEVKRCNSCGHTTKLLFKAVEEVKDANTAG